MLHVIGVLRKGIFLHHDFNNIVKVSCLLCNVAMDEGTLHALELLEKIIIETVHCIIVSLKDVS